MNESHVNDLATRVREEAKRLGLTNRHVLAAVSGGGDSVALLVLLCGSARELGINIAAVHAVHPMRGRAAERDATWVESLAGELGLQCFMERLSMPEGRPPTEAVMREARYETFERVAAGFGDALVALAHTADDNAETILLNVLRGTGPTGISGIPDSRGRFVRPLLGERRHVLRAFLEVVGHAWLEDLTNMSSLSRRGRVRHLLLPLLARDYNPRIVEALCRTSLIVREEDAFLEAESLRALEQSREYTAAGRMVLDSTVLSDYPASLVRRALRMAVRELLGPAASVDWLRAEALRALVAPGEVEREEPVPGLNVERRGRRLILWRARGEAGEPVHALLSIPGEAALPDLGIVVHAEVISRNLLRDPIDSLPREILVVPKQKLPQHLVLRQWTNGDRIRPFGMDGTKTVSDLLTDLKVPGDRRERVAVLCAGDEVLWVVGVRASEACRVTDDTRFVVRVVAEVEA